jgi:DNA-binding NtrC family response regulator
MRRFAAPLLCQDRPLVTGAAWTTDTPESRCQPMIALVVEDDPHVRSTIADLLRAEGHDVAEVANGRLALDLIRRRPFDLIMSDIRMPELGARGLYEHVGYFARPLLDRFIVITGCDDTDTVFFEAKTTVPILRKPFALVDLSAAIRRLLQGPTDDDPEMPAMEEATDLPQVVSAAQAAVEQAPAAAGQTMATVMPCHRTPPAKLAQRID